jgi:plastocyanin
MNLKKLICLSAVILSMPAISLATEHFVSIPGFSFDPASLTINQGDIVTWTNNHTVNHTTTSDDGTEWDSGTMAPGATFSHTFTTAGTFPYHCAIHPAMLGTITVEPATVPTLSEWGMIILALLLLAGGTVAVVRRFRPAESVS